jgi:hypothetical protein
MTILISSSQSYANFNEEKILSDEVRNRIISDISLDETELEAVKKEFVEWYEDEVFPRINNFEDYIHKSAIKIIAPNIYVIWTEGISPSAWGGEEFLYLISTESSNPKIIASIELAPMPSRTSEGYRSSVFWVNPNEGCGYNEFVRGILQYGNFGAGGSTFAQVYITYDRFEDNYNLTISKSPVFFSSPNCGY